MKDYSSINVLILLGGTSSRCWPLRDKMLFPIGGKTALEHQIERLISVGLTNITLVAGHHNIELAKSIFPQYEVLLQDNDLGTRGALLDSLGKFGSEPVLMLSTSDIVEAQLYTDVVEKGQQDDVDGVIVGQERSEYFPGGYLCIDGDRVTALHEAPPKGKEPSDMVHILTHYYHDASDILDILESVPDDSENGFAEAQNIFYTQRNFHYVRYTGAWQAIKYPWFLLDALEYYQHDHTTPQIDPSAEIHENAVVEGGVVIEAGVKILAGAIVRGPCTIGANTVIGHGTLIRQSSIGKGCVIGHSTEIARSIVGDHCWTHKNYIGDSILGHNVVMGAGSITTNLRLDAKEVMSVVKGNTLSTGRIKLGTVIGNNTRLGTHVTIEPGVKIGRDCLVQPKAHLTADVPDTSIVKVEQGNITVTEHRTTNLPDLQTDA
jgi:bifunctional UDP-N-acetylglucosamine pyrophosphorylase/glucosamine-1-phosphate N-acetyltransferase